MTGKLLTAGELASYLGLDVRTVYRLCRRRRLPHIRVNARCLRFEPQAIRRWLEIHQEGYWTVRSTPETRAPVLFRTRSADREVLPTMSR